MKFYDLLSGVLLLSSSTLLQAQSGLYIPSGDTVFVMEGTVLHVEGAITGSGDVKLEATNSAYAQLTQGTSAVNTGNVFIEKYLSNTSSGWRNFYFPFLGAYSSLDFNGTLAFINENNDGGISARRNFFKWNATDAGSGTATGWETISSTDNISNSAMVYLDNSDGVHTFNQKIRVEGVPANGSIAFALKNTLDPNYSGSTPADGTGWNYVGNPYPTNMSLTNLFNLASFPTYNAVHVMDVSTGNYVAVLASGVSITNYNTTGGSTTSPTHLEPFQGFWVKTDADATLTLDNSVRDASGTATNYLKSSFDLLRLNIIAPDNTVDQCVVYFSGDATTNYDLGLEAVKFYSVNPLPSIALKDVSGSDITIMALPSTLEEYIIPLKINSHIQGVNHQLELNVDDLPRNYTVFLEDTQTNLSYDLRRQSVNILPNAASLAGRYQLKLSSNGVSINENTNEGSAFATWTTPHSIEVRFAEVQSGQVDVLDISGRVLQSNPSENTASLTMEKPKSAGTYIVRFTSDAGNVLSQKVIVQ